MRPLNFDECLKSQGCFSEALLTLPSTLNVCKQEAPSPDNHIDNSK